MCAWMNQEKKAEIAALLKDVVPKTWKYSLSVRNHSTIVFTIKSAPVDLLSMCTKNSEQPNATSWQVNEFYLERKFEGSVLKTMIKIVQALNHKNFNNSDPMTDYFHVGHYVDLNIGRWDKPFIVK